MSKKKLQRFAEVKTFKNFFEPSFEDITTGYWLKGKWNTDHFLNDHPLMLELGCGKGEYAVGLARKYPDMNFIGIDIKGARMWRGAKTALEEKMANVAFLRTQIGLIRRFFAEREVDGIWITFPDPHPPLSGINKRLTSERFLDLYAGILKENAVIHLKTDDDGLFDFTLGLIDSNHRLLMKTRDLYHEFPEETAASIRTFYEKMWLDAGKKIKYLQFQL